MVHRHLFPLWEVVVETNSWLPSVVELLCGKLRILRNEIAVPRWFQARLMMVPRHRSPVLLRQQDSRVLSKMLLLSGSRKSAEVVSIFFLYILDYNIDICR